MNKLLSIFSSMKLNKSINSFYLTLLCSLVILSFSSVTAFAADYGDAPNTYGTNNGASHTTVSSSLYLGTNATDNEANGPSSGTGTTDDTTATDDEDSLVTVPNLYTNNSSYSVTVNATNTSGASANLRAWIDFDRNGTFDSDESAIAIVPNGITNSNIVISWLSIPSGTSAGTSYIRLRYTTDSLSTTDTSNTKSNGEVEDHSITINTALDYGDSLDFGDAPNTYKTTLSVIGPNHIPSTNLYLGTNFTDADSDGQPSTSALADDTNGSTPDDEDSISSIPTLYNTDTVYSISVRATNNTTSSANLIAWADFNKNGAFDSTEAATATVPAGTNATNFTLTWTGLSGIVTGQSYIRVRITTNTITSSEPGGAKTNGEVEDFPLTISQIIDYGDAPNSYLTTLPTGPRHTAVNNSLYMGATSPDSEANGVASTGADSDDTTGIDDEDSVSSFPTLFSNATTYTISVSVTNSTGSNATLAGWLDLNADGDFLDSGEFTTTTITSSASNPRSANLVWSGISGLVAGQSYVRLRISTDALASADYAGAKTTGEVEDHAVTINGATDFGDAPFQTTLAASGARHSNISSNLFLGTNATDPEFDGSASGTGVEDDNSGTDDEDSVSTFPTLLTTAGNYTLSVRVTNNSGSTANLGGWIDFNNSGAFESGEYASTTVNNGTTGGTATLTWSTIPTNTTAGNSYVRLRFTTNALANTDFVGLKTNGEVEDHTITITNTLDFGDAPNTYNTNGLTGARHTASTKTLFLGTNLTDNESTGPSGGTGTTDDTTGTDDEDSISTFNTLLTTDTTYSVSVRVNNTTGSTANLGGWIDFNNNGTFDDGEYTSTTVNTGTTGGTATLTWNSLSGLVAGNSYVRIRMTTDTLTNTDDIGAKTNGEIEDYPLTIVPVDFGDAPNTYSTTIASNGARHSNISSSLFLGTNATDNESDGPASGVGTSDDTTGTDDEDSVSTFPTLLTTASSYSLSVRVTNTSGSTANLGGWIDFNNSGAFESGEYASTTVATGTNGGTATLTWSTIPTNTTAGNSYVRLRFTTNGLANTDFSGLKTNGEVEDYPLIITNTLDFGDAPNTYSTNGATGARHTASTKTLYMGTNLTDNEATGPSGGTGTSDDTTGTDDEDSISNFPILLSTASGYSLSVNVTNNSGSTANLGGWIDFNRNNIFDDGEYTSTTVVTGTNGGTATLTWSSLSGLVVGNSYVRLRFTTDTLANTDDIGAKTSGEIEDYPISITSVDFGDAPNTYLTTFASGGAMHTPSVNLKLGSATTDTEADGVASANADSDDNNGTTPDDEDGITVPLSPLLYTTSSTYTLPVTTVNTTGANAILGGWIDFNRNNTFESTEFATATVVNNAITANLTWTVPTNTIAGASYVRLRITSSTNGLTSSDIGGLKANGEVEDFPITITQTTDFGDAPDSYTTNGASGVRHTASVKTLFMGTNAPDHEDVGPSGGTGTTDDTTGTDDEDGVSTFPNIFTISTTYSLSVSVTNTTGGSATLRGWIDFNRNNTFESGESATAVVANNATTATLSWTGLSGLVAGNTYVRIRITTDTLANTDFASAKTTGEVEDYPLTITGATDYGDAPNSYGTTLASNGARHSTSTNLKMGTNATDTETDGTAALPGGTPTSDDTTATDDEDITLPTLYNTTMTYAVNVPVTNTTGSTANLGAWMDINRNGNFADAGEFVSTTVANGATSANISWNVSSTTFTVGNNFYFRFRLTTDALASTDFVGFKTDGEVEDYRMTVTQTLDFGDAPNTYGTNGATGARHTAPTKAIFLGSIPPDHEATGPSGGLGEIDDNNGFTPDDEDALTTPLTAITTTTTTHTISVPVTNSSGGNVNLRGWIDFDRDGIFQDDEATTTSVTVSSSASNPRNFNLTWNNIGTTGPNIVGGNTYLRIRISGQAISAAQDINNRTTGEIEDYPFTITQGVDYGDAPDTYSTLEASTGAKHNMISTLFLGTNATDSDTDGNPTSGATGDDTTGITPDDEDSATFAAFCSSNTTYSVSVRVTNNSGSPANLGGWIDFNNNGTFETGEYTSNTVNTGTTGGNITLIWSVPRNTTSGSSIARLRFTTDTLLSSQVGGLKTNGEVEDHPVTINQCVDYGDAPNTYFTLNASGGAKHTGADRSIFLGVNAGDGEADGIPNANANGDDTTATDDEDSVATPLPILLSTATTYSVDVSVNNTSGANAIIGGWIDFNRNNVFDDGEYTSATVATGATGGNTTLTWSGLSGLVAGQSYVRLRITASSESLLSTQDVGAKVKGEVEDYPLTIYSPADFGDAPNTYLTTFASNGAMHISSANLYLGTGTTDTENDGIASVNADNDDNTGTDDENGITVPLSPLLYTTSSTYTLPVTTVNTTGANAILGGWIDFNRNNAFDTGEYTSATVANNATTANLTWTVPTNTTAGSSYVRLRITSSTNGLTSSDVGGLKANGEVEDFPITITQTTDFGDAPFQTSGGASHTGSNKLVYMGANPADNEANGPTGGTGVEDDSTVAPSIDDEDGVNTSTFAMLATTSSTYSVSVNVTNNSGSVARVIGWIDFNRNNTFESTEGSVVATVNTGTNGGTATLNWSGLSGIVSGQSYLRVRITTDALANTDISNAKTTGEVEDYPITINESYDYGDAPNTYLTTFASNGARHSTSTNLKIGANATDIEIDGLAGINANSDDTTATDDEDVVLSSLYNTQTSYSLVVNVTNTTGGNANLGGWIDFNRNNTFETGEYASTTVANNAATATLTWSSLSGLVATNTHYVRLRITTDSLANTDIGGFKTNGEVEDHILTISESFDYGDAPFQTTSASNGARHRFSSNIFMGTSPSNIDLEIDGSASGTGVEDDNSGSDDENGITVPLSPILYTTTGNYNLSVTVNNTSGSVGNLRGWIDFNRNNTFESTESASTTVTNGTTNGTATLTWTVPTNTIAGASYVRLRFTTDALANTDFVGLKTNGEVEDFPITITNTVDFGDAPNSYGTDGASGARHTDSTKALYMGTTLTDNEATGPSGGTGTTDDTTGTDDEDSVTLATLLSTDTTYSVNVNVTNNSGSTANLRGWIDFDGNGTFDDDESATATVNTGTNGGTSTLTWSNIGSTGPNIVAGNTYVRIRMTTDTLANTDDIGAKTSGEIEDYPLTIVSVDFGDAPFQTTLATSGARHSNISSNLFLGTNATDGELNGPTSGTGVEDDTSGTDDEDSVSTFPTLFTTASSYSLSVRVTNNSGSTANLGGWIDFNNSGAFESGEYASTTVNNGTTGGTATLTWSTIPTNTTAGNSYVRLRFTTDALANTDFVALKTNGEVEDHPITITNTLDFGDAPNSYGTDGANGARHTASTKTVFMGTNPADNEATGPSGGTGTTDDTTGTDDEDGISTFSTLFTSATTYSVSVNVTNNSGSTANLRGWIDFDGNGTFDDDESATATVNNATNGGTATLTWSNIGSTGPDIVSGNTYVRIRMTTDTLANTDDIGAKTSGEIEDYPLTISQAYDYGDAPSTYLTTLALDGARHISSTNLFLGTNNTDIETDGPASGTGTTDDTTGTDDEDSVTLATLYNTDRSYSVNVRVTNNSGSTANLGSWIDFNRNNTFETSEYASTTVATGTTGGTATLTWNIASTNLTVGTSYVRLRFTTDSLTSSDIGGLKNNGEVEDYQLAITQATDFGDANGFSVTTTRHTTPNKSLYLGNNYPDHEASGVASVNADSDDITGTDDEDGISSFSPLYNTDTTYSVNVNVTNNSGSSANLVAWIDFNRNNTFETNEYASTTVTNGTTNGTATLNWTGLSGLSIGQSYMRVRISTQSISSSEHNVNKTTGEIEDYPFTISEPFDYGDAPNSYSSNLASNGARHSISTELYMGENPPDYEANSPFGVLANGDDTASTDDEDGLIAPYLSSTFTTYRVVVNVTNNSGSAANLAGWIDFDGNGTFEADEYSTTSVPNNTNSKFITLTWNDIGSTGPNIVAGSTYGRFRVTTATLNATEFNNVKVNGEVEDHPITINPTYYVAPCPSLFGVAFSPATLWEINTSNAQTATNYPIAILTGESAALARSSDSRYAYFIDRSTPSNYLWIYDTHTNSLTNTLVGSGIQTNRLAAHPTDSFVYASSEDGHIYKYKTSPPYSIQDMGAPVDAPDNAVSINSSVGGDFAFDINGSFFYVDNTGNMWRINLNSLIATFSDSTLQGGNGIGFVGIDLYISDSSNQVRKYDPRLNSNTSIGTTNLPYSFLTDLASCEYPDLTPKLYPSKIAHKVAGSSGTSILPGDTIEYTINIRNIGDFRAGATVFYDDVPTSNVMYVPNSTYINFGDTNANTMELLPDVGSNMPFTTSLAREIHSAGASNGILNTDLTPSIIDEEVIITFRVMIRSTFRGTQIENQGSIGFKDGTPIGIKTDDPVDPTCDPLVNTLCEPDKTITRITYGDFLFMPSNASNALPGTTVIYPHIVQTKVAGDVTLSGTTDKGWTYIFFKDNNGNSLLDSGDTQYPGGSNVNLGDVYNLSPDHSLKLLVKLQVPAGISEGTVDNFNIIGTLDPTNPNLSNIVVPVVDTTTVSLTDSGLLRLIKAVSPTGPQKPGTVLTYTVTYTNVGTSLLHSVAISDIAPENTTFISATNGGTYDAGTKKVNWVIPGNLLPGMSGTVQFSIQIN
jgi:hypothetical protein